MDSIIFCTIQDKNKHLTCNLLHLLHSACHFNLIQSGNHLYLTFIYNIQLKGNKGNTFFS